MKSLLLGIGAMLAAASFSHAQTGFTITGGLSNFDCSNHCDYPCDEMEIDLDGAQPSEIVHTYTNGNYGAPTVTLSADGTYTIISYRNPQHLTQVNSIEHFGVTTRPSFYYGPPAVYHPAHVHWYRNGHLATVNGQVPTQGGGTTPATQPSQPTISAIVTLGSHGTGGVSLTVTNTDPVQTIWVKRSVQILPGAVTLEDLMPNNPIVTTSVQLDNAPLKLTPSQSFTVSNDLPFEIEGDQSAIFSAKYYQDIVGGDPFSPSAPGPELGHIMTATIANKGPAACAHSIPTILSQPASVTQDANTRVDLRVSGRGDDLTPLIYVWMKDGVAIVDGNGVSGSASNHLRIDQLAAANEGFYSVRITNTCATILSNSALVFITGHNQPPARVAFCAADFNHTGGATVQDIFDFLGAWFAGLPSADVNLVNGVTVQDIFDFLAAWFAGC